jgi:hypothetical protein
MFLPSDTWQAGTIDILRPGGKHLTVDSQVLNVVKFVRSGEHGLSGKPFAHSLRFIPSFGVVDSADSVVAAFPANGDGWVVTELR